MSPMRTSRPGATAVLPQPPTVGAKWTTGPGPAGTHLPLEPSLFPWYSQPDGQEQDGPRIPPPGEQVYPGAFAGLSITTGGHVWPLGTVVPLGQFTGGQVCPLGTEVPSGHLTGAHV